MTNKNIIAFVSCWTFVLVAIRHGCVTCVEGKYTLNESYFIPKREGAVKTIEVPEDGDLIDCVLFRKQPAFDHPLIKNIKVNPGLLNEDQNHGLPVHQNWHKYGKCPKGTVPIRRSRKNEFQYKNTVTSFQHSQKAGVVQPVGIYQGGYADISIMNPKTETNEYSSASIVVRVEIGQTGIEVGWIVSPQRYYDSKPRLFVYWQDEHTQGCFDVECPGYIHVSTEIALGSPLTVSQAGFDIHRGGPNGVWIIMLQGKMLGYVLLDVLPRMRDHAEIVEWGGRALDMKNHGHHTTTEMGSGHFPSEGPEQSAYMHNIQVYNQSYNLEAASHLQVVVSDPKCYDVIVEEDGSDPKPLICYGGPGYNPAQCP